MVFFRAAMRTIPWWQILGTLISTCLAFLLVDAVFYLSQGPVAISVTLLCVQTAITALLWVFLWVPWASMNHLQARMPALNQDDRMRRKSAYIRLMAGAGLSALILMGVSVLTALGIRAHHVLLGFSGLTASLSVMSLSVLVWAYIRCPF